VERETRFELATLCLGTSYVLCKRLQIRIRPETDLMRLAYVVAEGQPRVVPIWFGYDGGDLQAAPNLGAHFAIGYGTLPERFSARLHELLRPTSRSSHARLMCCTHLRAIPSQSRHAAALHCRCKKRRRRLRVTCRGTSEFRVGSLTC
jgi:nitroimidazol reductase NimA-like FMN-containing flavoprotein (pyridoxamine 5'-phosphate oxidase superfamily)